ncbi:MAG TPA: PAS domain-containing protein, partial [Flavobacterium sp.]|nr:PAS domain-containing protein [Flavobacterium sp.]
MNNLFEHAPCIYFSTSDDGTLLEVNDYLCTALGYDAADLVGKKIDVLLTIPSRIFQQTHFFPLLKLHGFTREIFLSLAKSNKEELPALINAVRKQVDGTPVCLYAGIVVQHRKKFEEELIAAKKSAETALNENIMLAETKSELQRHIEALDRRMHQVDKQHHELTQFTFVASHHLQEPVRKLMLFINMLKEKNKDADSATLINKIDSTTGQMREVLSDLQQYLWLQENLSNKKLVDLNKLVDESSATLKSQFPGILMHIEKDDLPFVEGEEVQLQLLIYHLLSNAIRFRKDADHVFVKISATTLKLNQFRHI